MVIAVEPRLAISGLVSRTDIWLLAIFTEGVLALLGGLAGWISVWAGSRGIRNVVMDAQAGVWGVEDTGPGSGGTPWVTVLGVYLLTIYAVGWLITRTWGLAT